MDLGLSSVLSLTSSEQLCSGGLAKNLFIAVLTSRLTCLWETASLLAVMPHPPPHTSTTGYRTLVEKGQAGESMWQHCGSLSAACLTVGRNHVSPYFFIPVINSEIDSQY